MPLDDVRTDHTPIAPHQGQRSRSLFPYIVLVCTPLLVFVLPLYVPAPPANTVSTSLLAGFNNTVSIASAVGLSLLVFLWSLWRHWGRTVAFPSTEASAPLPRGLVAGVIAATAALQSFAGWAIITAHQRYLSDAGYMIEQATVRALTGRSLYTQIEFAYGPLLVLPEVWLSRLLHCSVTAAYFALLVVESALGLLFLAYVLNHLPVRSRLRNFTFLLLAIAAVTPHVGLNYTFFRFASPLAVLVFADRVRSPWATTAVLALGVILVSLISPELGFALAAGVCIFGVVRALQRGPVWLAVAVLPTGLFAVLLSTLGRPYLRMAAMFSRGALNLPVGPYPHILLLLVALIWLVPNTMGRRLSLQEDRSAALLALFTTSAAFMPAALGRCDPLHVMFNGTGILVLALLAFQESAPWKSKAWIVALAFVVLWDQRVNDRIFKYRDAVTLREAVVRHLPTSMQDHLVHFVAHLNPYYAYLLSRQAQTERPVNMAELRSFVGTAPVATPMEISPTVEAQLIRAHLYDPGFFAFWVNTMNPGTEQRIVAFTNDHQWLLMPAGWQGGILQLPTESGLFQGLNLHYRDRQPMLYCPGALFRANLEDNWTPAWSFGSYILYKHTDNVVPQLETVAPSMMSEQCRERD